jgi:hypothetical protein
LLMQLIFKHWITVLMDISKNGSSKQN